MCGRIQSTGAGPNMRDSKLSRRDMLRASTVRDLPLIFNVTMINLPTYPEKWSISTRPMSDKVYQRAALCVTAKLVCQWHFRLKIMEEAAMEKETINCSDSRSLGCPGGLA